MDISIPTTSHIVPKRSMAAGFAYGAAVLFAAHLATYFIPAIRDVTLARSVVGSMLLAVLAVTQHLAVFPIISVLPAPRLARLAGYAWLVVDMATDLFQLGGAPKSLYLVLRLGINLVAALWIASASLQARGGIRPLGVFVAADFACYSCVALLSPRAFVVALPSLVLLPLWFVLAARHIVRLGLPADGEAPAGKLQAPTGTPQHNSMRAVLLAPAAPAPPPDDPAPRASHSTLLGPWSTPVPR